MSSSRTRGCRARRRSCAPAASRWSERCRDEAEILHAPGRSNACARPASSRSRSPTTSTRTPRISSPSSTGRLENEEESDRRASVAGRVVLARRHGKLTFLVIRDRTGDLQLFCEEATLGDGYGLLDEIDLGDIVGATGHVVSDAARGAVPQGGLAHDADEGASSAAREVARAAGPRPPAASALPPPDHRPERRAVRRGARHRAAHDPSRAGRSRIHRGRDARSCSRSPAARWPSRSRPTTTRWTPTSSSASRSSST